MNECRFYRLMIRIFIFKNACNYICIKITHNNAGNESTITSLFPEDPFSFHPNIGFLTGMFEVLGVNCEMRSQNYCRWSGHRNQVTKSLRCFKFVLSTLFILISLLLLCLEPQKLVERKMKRKQIIIVIKII